MTYGIPFQGSKSKIAKDIIDILPKGKRLCDLFGGGFAISHCALLSEKWEQVYYNEIDPLLVPLIKDAIVGKYSYENFKPKWISREEFHEKKHTDGYIKYIWSFGNNGHSYFFGKNTEKLKQEAHNLVVFGNKSDLLNGLLGKNVELPQTENITERRLAFNRFAKNCGNRFDLEQLERLERLQRLELNTGCYTDYIYQDGDIVYCDIPYENTAGYQNKVFDHKKFYDWAKSRDFAVFFSSYEISENSFECIWQKERLSTMSATNNSLVKAEKLYWNKK